MDTSPNRYRVLLLEDNPLDAELAQGRLLRCEGEFDVTVVDARQPFIDAFEGNTYDLVLADYSLPDFDGLGALAIVRGDNKRLPFIFVSGVLGEDVAVETMLRGATDYVVKQKLDRLVPAVNRALSEHAEYKRRAVAETELRAVEANFQLQAERQAVLLALLQQQRVSTSSPESMLKAASEAIGDFFKASRVEFEENVRPPHEYHDSFASGNPALYPGHLAVAVLRHGKLCAGLVIEHATPHAWVSGEIAFVQEVADITWDSVERSKAQLALAASEQRLSSAAQTANLGSWDLNLVTGGMECSDVCKQNFGCLIDERFSQQNGASIHPEDRAAVSAAIDEAIATHTTYRSEYRIVWPDGSLHWVIASGRPTYNDEGKAIRMTGFSLDVTERHLAQHALLQSEKLAAVGRLAASIAHEINNPLESVTNLLYLARSSGEIDQIEGYLETAEVELRRVSAITNQTLRFYRQASHPRVVSIEELFESVLSIYQGRLVNRNIQIETRFWASNGVECLDGEIRQVLNNLVGNALDAMQSHGGKLYLRSRDIRMPDGKEGVILTIADTGVGMAQSTQSKVFEAFYTTKGLGGTGLGLWVSKEIVDRHRGRLRFRSTQTGPKTGTVFSLFLPCR